MEELTKKPDEYGDIDEAEEEALLKSDEDDGDDNGGHTTVIQIVSDDGIVAEDADDALRNNHSGEHGLTKSAVGEADADSDDTDDESNNIFLEYTKVFKELNENQYAYDKYIRLCELSHATEDLSNIRNAYGLFSYVYPLAPELWIKYLKIESTIAVSEKEVEKVYELFQTALRDYYSTDIANEYTGLASRIHSEKIWNEVLGTYGLHCIKGQQFFKDYRVFIANKQDMSDEEKQDAHIQSYLRELKLPLFNMEESYIEFKVYCEVNKAKINREIDWETIDKFYFKAKEHLQKILPFESQLMDLDKNCYREKAEVYNNYIKKSDKFLDENILQTVYERMVADCCLNPDCWLIYISFLEYRDEFGRPEELQDLPIFQQTALDVNNRGLRNCSWNEKLYIKRIHVLENMKKSQCEIKEIFENSLAAGLQNADSVVAIWLAYLAYLRRHTDWDNDEECEKLRKNFNFCWNSLGQQFGVLADCNCEILQFWGRLEYGPLEDPKKGKELWTTVMESSDNYTKSGLWIEFCQLEMRRDFDSTRRLFRKALHTTDVDNPFVIASAWQRFERCNGNLKHLTECITECEKFLQQQAAPSASGDDFSKSNKGKGTKRKSTSSSSGVDLHDTKKQRFHEHEQSAATAGRKSLPLKKSDGSRLESGGIFKEHENQEIDMSKDHLRIFLSNLDYNLNEEDIRQGLPELNISTVNLIRSANGKSRGFGYLELESANEVEKALAMDRRNLNERPVYISSVLRDKEKRQKFKYSDAVEPKKLFVKGLPHDVTKEELEQMFGAFGKLIDVRLVFHKSGKFKGIAYVEFENKTSASKALMAIDQIELRGHLVSVAISAPPPKPSGSGGRAVSSTSPSKLLGLGTRRKAFDQKPKMSLIPMAVRKKFTSKDNDGSMPPPPPLPSATNGTITKTNEDFRKLLKRS